MYASCFPQYEPYFTVLSPFSVSYCENIIQVTSRRERLFLIDAFAVCSDKAKCVIITVKCAVIKDCLCTDEETMY